MQLCLRKYGYTINGKLVLKMQDHFYIAELSD